MTNGIRSAVIPLLTGVALAASGVVATAAFAADPSGCDAGPTTIGLDSDHRLMGLGSGTCQDYSLRYFTGEIKWSKRFAPDPLTASVTSSDHLHYSVDVRTCDHGNTRNYYARAYWTSTRGYHDSAHVEFEAC